jgi:hypothetical protein
LFTIDKVSLLIAADGRYSAIRESFSPPRVDFIGVSNLLIAPGLFDCLHKATKTTTSLACIKLGIGFGMSDLSKEIGSLAAYQLVLESIRSLSELEHQVQKVVLGGSMCPERAGISPELVEFWNQSVKIVAPTAELSITLQDDQSALIVDSLGTNCPIVNSRSMIIPNRLNLRNHQETIEKLEVYHNQMVRKLLPITSLARAMGLAGTPLSDRPSQRSDCSSSFSDQLKSIRAIALNSAIYSIGFTLTSAVIGKYAMDCKAIGKAHDAIVSFLDDAFPSWRYATRIQSRLLHSELFRELAVSLYMADAIDPGRSSDLPLRLCLPDLRRRLETMHGIISPRSMELQYVRKVSLAYLRESISWADELVMCAREGLHLAGYYESSYSYYKQLLDLRCYELLRDGKFELTSPFTDAINIERCFLG